MTTNKYNIASATLGPSALFNGSADVDGVDAAMDNKPNWNKPSLWMQEEETYSALTSSTQGYGQTIKKEITTTFDKAGPMWLQYDRSALTQDLVTPANFRFHDWEPIASLNKIEFKYNEKVFWTVRPMHLFYLIMNRTPQKYKNRLALALSGFTSHDERLTLANAAQTYRLPLFLPWESLNRHLPHRALPNKILVETTFNNLVDCGYVSSSGFTVASNNGVANTLCTITNCKIVVEGIHKELSKKQAIFNMGMKGLDWKVYDIETQENATLASGSTTYTIDIDQIKNDTFELFFILRPTSKVPSGTMSTSTNPWYFVKCLDYVIKDGNKNLFDVIVTADFESFKLHEIHPLSCTPNPFHIIPFAPRKFIEASDFNCFGSRALVHYNKPQLVLDFASALGSNTRLDMFALNHQILRVQKGNIRLLFDM